MKTLLEEMTQYRNAIQEDYDKEPKADLSASIYGSPEAETAEDEAESEEESIADQYKKVLKRYENAQKKLYEFMKDNIKSLRSEKGEKETSEEPINKPKEEKEKVTEELKCMSQARLATELHLRGMGYNDTDLREIQQYLNGPRTCNRFDNLSGWAKGCIQELEKDPKLVIRETEE